MVKLAIGVGVGVVAGYSLSRVLEARANKVVIGEAFKLDFARLLTPTATLRDQTLATLVALKASSPSRSRRMVAPQLNVE